MRVALQTHYGLYKQDWDEAGTKLYAPLVELAKKANSVEELEQALR